MKNKIVLREKDKNNEFVIIECDIWAWNFIVHDMLSHVEVVAQCYDMVNNEQQLVATIPFFNILYIASIPGTKLEMIKGKSEENEKRDEELRRLYY